MSESNKKTFNDVLEDIKGKNIVVGVAIGIDENDNIHLVSNNSSFPVTHWLINRALFQLNILENQQLAQLRAQAEIIDVEPQEAGENVN